MIAQYCNSYTTEGTNAGDWYLPAAGELYSYVYSNYDKLSNTWINKLAWDSNFKYDFWSSSENSTNLAYHLYLYDGIVRDNYKNIMYSVTCFLSL